MALANRALFGSRFEENNRPGIEMNVDGSMEVVLPDGSRNPLTGGGAEFPTEWTVGNDGSLRIDVSTAGVTLLEVRDSAANQVAKFSSATGSPGLIVKNSAGSTQAALRIQHAADELVTRTLFDARNKDGASIFTLTGRGNLDLADDLGNSLMFLAPNTDTFAVSPDGTNTVFQITGTAIGFYGHAVQAQQTGVAVDAAAIHAALVNLGLITA